MVGARVAKGASVGTVGVATFATVGSGESVGIKVAIASFVVSPVPSTGTADVTADEDGVAGQSGVEALEVTGGIVGSMVSEGVSDEAGLAGVDV